MKNGKSVLTLLTDFGMRDGFVGIMKGVIHSIHPDTPVIDIAHDIPAGQIDIASFVINRAYPFFPKGSIHVIVVDPGVGSGRRVIAVDIDTHLFIAPDNGVLKWIFKNHPECTAYNITNTDFFLHPLSRTFHGRDIFAPVAAHIAAGVNLNQLGPQIQDYSLGHIPKLEIGYQGVRGEIIYIDRFGNLISNIHESHFKDRKCLESIINTIQIKGLCDSYSDVDTGTALNILGSHGYFEVAIRGQSAQNNLNVALGDYIYVRFK